MLVFNSSSEFALANISACNLVVVCCWSLKELEKTLPLKRNPMDLYYVLFVALRSFSPCFLNYKLEY